MALFGNRNKKTIAQLEEYYSNKNNTGRAWAMAFLSLLLTVVLLSSLFFGGRWVYRALTDDDNSDNVADTTVVEGELLSLNNDKDSVGLEIVTDDPQTQAIVGGTVSDEAASTNIPSTNNDEAVAGASIDSESDIPNTGAGEILLITPLFVFILGYILSLKFQSAKSTK